MAEMDEQSVTLLRDALTEVQTSVRAYDTKAQIVGVGYVFALGVIGRTYEALPGSHIADIPAVVITWLVVILPILLFGYVLYPTRKTAAKMKVAREASGPHVLFYEPDANASVETIKRAAIDCDPVDEMAFELLKVSRLRELKRTRFLRALFAAGIAFAVMFFGQIAILLLNG